MTAVPQPTVEVARKRRGTWHIYASLYRRPLRIFVFGRWLIGRPR